MFRKYVHLIDKRLFVLYNLRKEHLFATFVQKSG